ncbi:MAG: Hint domain-containing protein [Polyangiaceae bacterium]
MGSTSSASRSWIVAWVRTVAIAAVCALVTLTPRAASAAKKFPMPTIDAALAQTNLFVRGMAMREFVQINESVNRLELLQRTGHDQRGAIEFGGTTRDHLTGIAEHYVTSAGYGSGADEVVVRFTLRSDTLKKLHEQTKWSDKKIKTEAGMEFRGFKEARVYSLSLEPAGALEVLQKGYVAHEVRNPNTGAWEEVKRGSYPSWFDDDQKRMYDEAKRATCQCFVSGTTIATAKGPKPIESIGVGDKVWSIETDGEPKLHDVLSTRSDPPRPTHWVTLERDGTKERLETTEEHPFFVIGKGWTVAAALHAGDFVVTRQGHPSVVVASENSGRSAPTFNFEVATAHDYYVGKSESLVHNACPVAKSRPKPTSMARARMNAAGGLTAGLLANYLASYAGGSLGGDAGALGAAFAAGTVMGKLGGGTWRLSAGGAGVSVGAGFLTSWALTSAGVTDPKIHTGAGIVTGALADGAFTYAAVSLGWMEVAAGGTAATMAGSAILYSGLYGVLAAEVLYLGSQYYELWSLAGSAADGNEAAMDAMNEITFGVGKYLPKSRWATVPTTLYMAPFYGVYSWATRPGEVLGDLWRHGL